MEQINTKDVPVDIKNQGFWVSIGTLIFFVLFVIGAVYNTATYKANTDNEINNLKIQIERFENSQKFNSSSIHQQEIVFSAIKEQLKNINAKLDDLNTRK